MELNITGKYTAPIFNVRVNCGDEGDLDAHFELLYIFANNTTSTFFYSHAWFLRMLPVQSNEYLPSLSIASCLAFRTNGFMQVHSPLQERCIILGFIKGKKASGKITPFMHLTVISVNS